MSYSVFIRCDKEYNARTQIKCMVGFWAVLCYSFFTNKTHVRSSQVERIQWISHKNSWWWTQFFITKLISKFYNGILVLEHSAICDPTEENIKKISEQIKYPYYVQLIFGGHDLVRLCFFCSYFFFQIFLLFSFSFSSEEMWKVNLFWSIYIDIFLSKKMLD